MGEIPEQFSQGYELWRCWAAVPGQLDSCRYREVTDLGLCLLCYRDKFGRLPDGYTEEDVALEIKRRKKQKEEEEKRKLDELTQSFWERRRERKKARLRRTT